MSGNCLNLGITVEIFTVTESFVSLLATEVPFQHKGHAARVLSTEEQEKLKNDTKLVSDFKQQKLEKEACKNWDLFYKRNTTKFYKDRHWTKREFEELCVSETGNKTLTVLEAGCGVGNFMFPLLEEDHEKRFQFYSCDFSPRAVEFVRSNPLFDPARCKAFQCDLTQDQLENEVPSNSVDVATLIFVLSAILPSKMLFVLKNIRSVLSASGVLLFRDYGLYDHAMLRFGPGHKLLEQFYVRQDGTRAYYFSVEELTGLFNDAGLEVLSCEYVQRETVNVKQGLAVPRIFVQAKCRNKVAEEKSEDHS